MPDGTTPSPRPMKGCTNGASIGSDGDDGQGKASRDAHITVNVLYKWFAVVSARLLL